MRLDGLYYVVENVADEEGSSLKMMVVEMRRIPSMWEYKTGFDEK